MVFVLVARGWVCGWELAKPPIGLETKPSPRRSSKLWNPPMYNSSADQLTHLNNFFARFSFQRLFSFFFQSSSLESLLPRWFVCQSCFPRSDKSSSVSCNHCNHPWRRRAKKIMLLLGGHNNSETGFPRIFSETSWKKWHEKESPYKISIRGMISEMRQRSTGLDGVGASLVVLLSSLMNAAQSLWSAQ